MASCTSASATESPGTMAVSGSLRVSFTAGVATEEGMAGDPVLGDAGPVTRLVWLDG